MRVAVRERVLDGIAIRTIAGRRVEQRDDLAEQGGRVGHGGGPTWIIRGAARHGMGREAHLRLVVGPFAILVLVAMLLASSAGAARTALAPRLERALRVPHVDPSRTAALAIDLRTGAVVYSRNEGLSLVPASNEKLAVTYAALATLGHRVSLSHRGGGRRRAGRIRVARQPRLARLRRPDSRRGGPRPARGRGGRPRHHARDRVGRRRRGVVRHTSARGRAGCRGSTSRSRRRSRRSSSIGRMYRGRMSRNPALAAASLFRAALETRGMRVRARSRVGAPPPGVLARAGRLADSWPRSSASWAARATTSPPSCSSSTSRPRRASRHAAERRSPESVSCGRRSQHAGVPLAGVRLVDGSGLSRLNRLTAAAVVALLEAGLARPDFRDAFLASLAVAGVDGTLEHRLERLPGPRAA